MTWGISDPVDGELAANKTNKDGSDLTNPANWRGKLLAGEEPQAWREGLGLPGMLNALAPVEGLVLTGGLSGLSPAVGLRDFTYRFLIDLSGTNFAALGTEAWLFNGGAASRVNARIFASSSSLLRVFFRDHTGTQVFAATANLLRPWPSGRFNLLLRFIRAGNLEVYFDAEKVGELDISATAGIDIAASSETVLSMAADPAARVTFGGLDRFVYAIPATSEAPPIGILQRYQKKEWVTAGDDHLTLTPYVSDFSAASDQSAQGGTQVANQNGIGGRDGCLKFYANTANSNNHSVQKAYTGYRRGYYRVKAEIYIPADNTTLKRVFASYINEAGNNTVDMSGPVTDLGMWVDLDLVTYVQGSTVTLRFRTAGLAASTYVGADDPDDDIFYIRGIELRPLGAAQCLIGNQGLGRQIHDTSANRSPVRIDGAATWLHKHTRTQLIQSDLTTAPAGRAIALDSVNGIITGNARPVDGGYIKNTGANSITTTIQCSTAVGSGWFDITPSFTLAAGASKRVALLDEITWPAGALFVAIGPAGAATTVDFSLTLERIPS